MERRFGESTTKLTGASIPASLDLCTMATSRRSRIPKDLAAIERAAKRADQKAAGVFDGRYRTRVKKSGKRYRRRPRHRGSDEQ
jgi:hypothetical protein